MDKHTDRQTDGRTDGQTDKTRYWVALRLKKTIEFLQSGPVQIEKNTFELLQSGLVQIEKNTIENFESGPVQIAILELTFSRVYFGVNFRFNKK